MYDVRPIYKQKRRFGKPPFSLVVVLWSLYVYPIIVSQYPPDLHWVDIVSVSVLEAPVDFSLIF